MTTPPQPETCELILDHDVQWAGDGYYCSKCMLRFVPQELPSHPTPMPLTNPDPMINEKVCDCDGEEYHQRESSCPTTPTTDRLKAEFREKFNDDFWAEAEHNGESLYDDIYVAPLLDFIFGPDGVVEQVRAEERERFAKRLLACKEGNWVGIGIITREAHQPNSKEL